MVRLGQSLRLPQCEYVALVAPLAVPYLDPARHRQWYDSFDAMTGDLDARADPTDAVRALHGALAELRARRPEYAIHLFGFGQGGSVVAQALRSMPDAVRVASAVTVCGPLPSDPAPGAAPQTETAVLVASRPEDGCQQSPFRRAFGTSVRFHDLGRPTVGEGAAMPGCRADWLPIMQCVRWKGPRMDPLRAHPRLTSKWPRFWSERLRMRPNVSGELVEIN